MGTCFEGLELCVWISMTEVSGLDVKRTLEVSRFYRRSKQGNFGMHVTYVLLFTFPQLIKVVAILNRPTL